VKLFFVCVIGLVAGFSGCGQEKKESSMNSSNQQSNVVFIFTDDLGYGDVTCYNAESKITTPHINRLASQGMRFTDAHTSSAVCTPSRYSLLTGRYCWRTEHKTGVQGGYDLPLIEKGRMTLGNLFQNKGYKTAAIGKWHVGMEWTLKKGFSREDQEMETVDHGAALKITPVDQGFDYYFGTSGCTSDDPPFCFIENRRILDYPLKLSEELNVIGDGDFVKDVLMAEDWQHERADTTFTSKAIEFMETQVKNETPFFIYLALSLPHIPWLPSEFVKGTTDAGPRGDLVALADYCIGKIDEALIGMGVEDNTIVIFSSDNGPREGENGHQSAGPLRGLKGQIFEGGHRVPLIIRWPKKIESAAICDETVCMTDFMATFASILDVTLPEGMAEDSYDMSPLLFGKEITQPIRKSTVHHSGAGAFAIRKGDWKIIFGKVDHGEIPEDPSKWKKR
jgi:arylsulfatase A